MKAATETKREYGDHGRLLFRCVCECHYRTTWYPLLKCAEGQLAYHDEQNHIAERARVARQGTKVPAQMIGG